MKLEQAFKAYTQDLIEGLSQVPMDQLSKLVQHLIEISDKSKNLYIMGNGGSCATSAHMANDLHGISLRVENFNIRVEAIGQDSALISGIANDFGFEHSYSKILENKLREGDSVLLISASGNSSNLIEAAKVAKEKNCHVLSMVGFDGGELKKCSDICVHTPSELGEYEKSEDFHLILNHFLRTYLTKSLS